MSDYKVGYGKPPREHQFKPATSGNPAGRPPRAPPSLASIISDVVGAPINYQEGGRPMTGPAWLVILKAQISRALQGDVDAALEVLRFWKRAAQNTSGELHVVISDWLPDYPGQTAEEKTREYARRRTTATK